ncbi:MAG: hypothetical protein K5876_07265 [Ruminiclostridium sp.]|nr:hypothetical protein [Ruminiclostridium sp.]
MKVTSAQAAKLLRKLVDERNSIASAESRSSSFNAAVGEDIESVRPAYDYAATQKAIENIETKIRKLKHEINLFNVRQTVPGFDMTIDQMLVYLPQLCRQRDKLDEMRSVLPKTRAERSIRATNINIIDYTYANYDIAEAEKDYNEISDLLAKGQTALDTVNNTVEFEIEI